MSPSNNTLLNFGRYHKLFEHTNCYPILIIILLIPVLYIDTRDILFFIRRIFMVTSYKDIDFKNYFKISLLHHNLWCRHLQNNVLAKGQSSCKINNIFLTVAVFNESNFIYKKNMYLVIVQYKYLRKYLSENHSRF